MKISDIRKKLLILKQDRSRLVNQSSLYRGTIFGFITPNSDPNFSPSGRRQFLRLSLLATGAALVPAPLYALAPDKPSGDVHAQARTLFYQRRYSEAEALLKPSLAGSPKAYRLLGKIYAVQGRFADKTLLYETALAASQGSVFFKTGLARSLYQLGRGKAGEIAAYRQKGGSSSDLSARAQQLVSEVLAAQPGNASAARLQQSGTPKKRTKQPFPFKDKDGTALEQALSKLDTRKRRELYFEDEKKARDINRQNQKRKLLIALSTPSIAGGEQESALRRVLAQAPEDTRSYRRLCDLLKSKGQHDRHIQLRAERYAQTSAFSSGLGLAKAHLEAYGADKDNSHLDTAWNITAQLQAQDWPDRHLFALGMLQVKILTASAFYARAEEKLALLAQKASDGHSRQMTVQAALKLYAAQGLPEQSLALARWAGGQGPQPDSPIATALNDGFTPLTGKASLPLLHAMAQSYTALGQTEQAKAVYRSILEVQPKDKQAAKKS